MRASSAKARLSRARAPASSARHRPWHPPSRIVCRRVGPELNLAGRSFLIGVRCPISMTRTNPRPSSRRAKGQGKADRPQKTGQGYRRPAGKPGDDHCLRRKIRSPWHSPIRESRWIVASPRFVRSGACLCWGEIESRLPAGTFQGGGPCRASGPGADIAGREAVERKEDGAVAAAISPVAGCAARRSFQGAA